MRFMSFFGPSPLGIFITAIIVILIVAVIFVGVNVILAFSGGPGPCTPGGGPITVNAANADGFQQKWDGFDAVLDGGTTSSVSFNESEISSRADQYIRDETDVDFADVRICIHDGFGEASAKLEAILGLETEVMVTGTVDLTGDTPQAQITDIEIGNVPSFIVDIVEGQIEDAVDEALENIDLSHTYTPTLTEGQALIDGEPKP
ncbi:hypothetical protein LCGC14_1950510 [marine sediment metagenome]|uniref:Uncharacterized protein n=1 Tax=marine sediment metagenome TaxID=412755 RepID=A0A0F9HW32_9ZZZZ